MRNVFIILFFVFSLVVYGCSDRVKAQDNPVTEKVLKNEDSDTVDELKKELESVKEELKELQRLIDEHQKLIDDHKKVIEEWEENKYRNGLIWVIIAYFMIVAVFILMLYEKRGIKKRLDRHRSDINKLLHQRDACKKEANITKNKKETVFPSQSCSNNFKIQYERPTSTENRSHTPVMEPKTEKTPDPAKEEMKTGYFGMLIGNKYFNELMTSRNDNALFKACVGDVEGVFEVFSLDAIRSIDGIEKAVHKEGISIKDARHFDVIQKGKVRKDSKGNWEIIIPTIIKLS